MTGPARLERGTRRLLADLQAMQQLQDGPLLPSAPNPSPEPQLTGTGADDKNRPTVGCGEPAPCNPPHGAAGSPEPNTHGSQECERPAPRDPRTGSHRGAGQEGR